MTTGLRITTVGSHTKTRVLLDNARKFRYISSSNFNLQHSLTKAHDGSYQADRSQVHWWQGEIRVLVDLS